MSVPRPFSALPGSTRSYREIVAERANKRQRPPTISEGWRPAPHDLHAAYLARCIDPATSLPQAGQAQVVWPGREPVLQAAYEQAFGHQPERWTAAAILRGGARVRRSPRASESESEWVACGRSTSHGEGPECCRQAAPLSGRPAEAALMVIASSCR